MKETETRGDEAGAKGSGSGDFSPAPFGPRHKYRDLTVLVLGAALVFLVWDFLAPLLLGGVFAVVLFPFHRRLQRLGWTPWVSAFTVTLSFTLVFFVPLGALVFAGAEAGLAQLQNLRAVDGQDWTTVLRAWGIQAPGPWLERWFPGGEEQFSRLFEGAVATFAATLVDLLRNVLGELPKVTISGLIVIVSVYYLLLDGHRVRRFVRENSSFSPRNTEAFFRAIQKACHSAIFASLITGLIQACLMAIACLLAGVTNVVLVSLITFLFSFVPVVGTAPISIVLTAYHLLLGDYTGAALFVGAGIFIGISDNIARPYFIRGGTLIHPLAAFLFTFGALSVIGFYGLFLGPVAAALLFVLLRIIDQGPHRAHSVSPARARRLARRRRARQQKRASQASSPAPSPRLPREAEAMNL